MKVLYVDYRMFDKEDIMSAFRKNGHSIDETDVAVKYKNDSQKICEGLKKVLLSKRYDMVFTSNFFVDVSKVCQELSVKYVSWTYDSPRLQLYEKEVLNSCNYLFIFDSDECRRLIAKGVKNVYYMPLGADVERINSIEISNIDKEKYSADISFVGSLYNERGNFYERLIPKISDYTKGYLEAVIESQVRLVSGSMLEECLADNRILSEMINALPYGKLPFLMDDYRYIYAYYMLGRRVATLQRCRYISDFSEDYTVKVYTPGDISGIPKAIDMNVVEYRVDAYKVYRCSKINLNITLPSIKTGIPLRAIDIMAAGGFLLTNYQSDFDGFFEPGIDYVYYTSFEEAKELADYYLHHDDERMLIAENARQKIAEAFTYNILIGYIIDIVLGKVAI